MQFCELEGLGLYLHEFAYRICKRAKEKIQCLATVVYIKHMTLIMCDTYIYCKLILATFNKTLQCTFLFCKNIGINSYQNSHSQIIMRFVVNV